LLRLQSDKKAIEQKASRKKDRLEEEESFEIEQIREDFNISNYGNNEHEEEAKAAIAELAIEYDLKREEIDDWANEQIERIDEEIADLKVQEELALAENKEKHLHDKSDKERQEEEAHEREEH